mgnify:CR=1 FL=1
MGCTILDGCGNIIDKWLGIDSTWDGKAPRYGHKSSLLWLQEHPPASLDGLNLIKDLLAKIHRNWKVAGCLAPRSMKNWRFNKQLHIAEHSKSREKILEKAIVAPAITGDDWANMIPTSAGLTGSEGRHRNIDLAQRDGTSFTFIELKWLTNNPLFAAMEILQYGLIYVFSRQNIDQLRYCPEKQPCLTATHLGLRVLGPTQFYAPYNVCWLQEALSTGLLRFSKEVKPAMDFAFEVFPLWFGESWFQSRPEAELKKALKNIHRVCGSSGKKAQ